jgi:two-component system, cell cycle sensor histidine kinase and response regulator CckA
MSISIFIVEDERIVAEDIRVTLESNGYTVAGIAASRDQALEAIRRTMPNLVLMDIILKGPGDGVETARLVRERFDIPVVYLTAHADAGTLHRAKVTEPFGYVVKPFQEPDLFTAIQMALYRHGVEKRLQENERWMATILGSLSEGVIAAEAMGVVRLANPAAERIGGWGPGELVGLELSDVYQTKNLETGADMEVPGLPALIEQPSSGSRDVRLLVRKDGGRVIVEQSIAPISDSSGTVSGSVVVFRELPLVSQQRGQL